MHERVAVALVLLAAASGCIELIQEDFSTRQGREGKPLPTIGFADDEASDRIVVMEASADAHWADINITADRPAYVRLNDGPIREFSPTRQANVAEREVSAGDKLDFCVPSGGGLETRLLYTPENVVVHVFTFSALDEHRWCR